MINITRRSIVARLIVILFFFALLSTIGLGIAEKNKVVPPDNLWKIIIREAVGEADSYSGMYSVCCVYRNRLEKGMKLGATASKRRNLESFVRRHKSYHKMAKQIVDKVFYGEGEDVTFGATHYENIKKYKTPWWAKDMKITTKIGSHTFYKEK